MRDFNAYLKELQDRIDAAPDPDARLREAELVVNTLERERGYCETQRAELETGTLYHALAPDERDRRRAEYQLRIEQAQRLIHEIQYWLGPGTLMVAASFEQNQIFTLGFPEGFTGEATFNVDLALECLKRRRLARLHLPVEALANIEKNYSWREETVATADPSRDGVGVLLLFGGQPMLFMIDGTHRAIKAKRLHLLFYLQVLHPEDALKCVIETANPDIFPVPLVWAQSLGELNDPYLACSFCRQPLEGPVVKVEKKAVSGPSQYAFLHPHCAAPAQDRCLDLLLAEGELTGGWERERE